MAPFAVLALGVLLLVLLADRPQDTGRALDPGSTGPLGTRALVDVLQATGAAVSVIDEPPGPDVDSALLLADAYDEPARDELLEWVRQGGTLVVADPFSQLVGEPVNSTDLLFTNPPISRGCDLPALADVGSVTSPGGSVYALDDDATGCFPRNEAYWLTATPRGDGTVVALGGAQGFTNVELGAADNALLAVTLLAPEPPQARVAVLGTPPPGSGEETLADLVPPEFAWAGVQLLVAFGLIVAWRARRFGPPVLEPAAVEVPGSELVVARGNLLQSTSAARHAAGVLREDARRWLAASLGLPARADAEQVADAAAARTGARREEVLDLVGDRGHGPLTDRARRETSVPSRVDEDALVRIAQQLEAARRTALAPPPPVPDPPTPDPPTEETRT